MTFFCTSASFCFSYPVYAEPGSNYSGWVTNYDTLDSLKPLLENMSHYETVWLFGPNVKDLKKQGSVWWQESKMFDEVVAEAKARKVRVGPVFHNSTEQGFDGALGWDFVKSPDAKIEIIQQEVKKHGWRAINIDLESLPESSAADFENFLRKLHAKLQKMDVKISVCLHARDAAKVLYEGAQFQRWEKLKKIDIDFVIMAYDYSWSTSAPGPVAPWSWVEKVADYSKEQFKGRRMIMGLPLFGYHWKKEASQVNGWKGRPDIYPRLEKEIQTDGWQSDKKMAQVDGKIYRKASDEVIAFDDEQALQEKIKKLEIKKIRQFAIWRLGGTQDSFYKKSESKQ